MFLEFFYFYPDRSGFNKLGHAGNNWKVDKAYSGHSGGWLHELPFLYNALVLGWYIYSNGVFTFISIHKKHINICVVTFVLINATFILCENGPL